MATTTDQTRRTTPPSEQRPRAQRLPPQLPRTTTQLLLARGGDPFEHARAIVASAQRTTAELVEFLPAEQRGLRTRFGNIAEMLETTARVLATWQLSPVEAQLLMALTVPSWAAPTVIAGAPTGSDPVNPDPHAEPVYGFRSALAGVRDYLKETTEAIASTGVAGAHAMGYQRFFLAGGSAHAAAAVDHLLGMYTAAVWDFERPAMPALPSMVGRIELRASPRALPQTRWARYARVLFMPDRVELTTEDGRETIGASDKIAYLMHVAPPSPTSVVARYDLAERYADVPLFDELGVVHFCTADGQSMGAIAVADWLAQPELTVGQPASLNPTAPRLRAQERLIWPLQAAGIAAAPATLHVPIRRGAVHPPQAPAPVSTRAETARRAPNTVAPELVPLPLAARVVRPGAHLLPYRGTATRPATAQRRRARRRNVRNIDMGPASPASSLIRMFAGPAILIGGIGSAYVFTTTWLVRLSVILMFAAVLEPWLWWCARWLLDRDNRKMVATYRPGGGAGQTRRFLQRSALLFDGANIGARSATGHEAWVAAPSDSSLGVVALKRLMHDGEAWGLAFVDRSGVWRLVLPAKQWAPGGDLTGLAGFAQAAGLQVGDLNAVPVPVTNDAFVENSPFAQTRSVGPRTRGMVILAIYALAVLPMTLLRSEGIGWAGATLMLAIVAAIALVPTALRALWLRWGQSATPSA